MPNKNKEILKCKKCGKPAEVGYMLCPECSKIIEEEADEYDREKEDLE